MQRALGKIVVIISAAAACAAPAACAAAAAGATAAAGAAPAIAADEVNFVTPKVQEAVRKALSYLKRTQNPGGSWGSSSYGRHPAITALATMAMMAQGNLPGRGKYGKNVERGIKFLMKQVDPKTGYIGGGGHGQMYGHGFATLCLAETYGIMPSSQLREKLRLAIRCITPSISSSSSTAGKRRSAMNTARVVAIILPRREA